MFTVSFPGLNLLSLGCVVFVGLARCVAWHGVGKLACKRPGADENDADDDDDHDDKKI